MMDFSDITNEPIRALIIEDEEGVQKLLRGLLHGFDCECVSTLQAGLAICRTLDIRLVVLDLGLEDAYGFDGLRALVEQFPHIPVVILTGDTNEERPMKALQLGAQAFITKPIMDAKAFYREVCYAMARHRNVRIALNRVKELEMRVSVLEAELKRRKSNRWKLKVGIITGIIGVLTALAAFFKEFIGLFKKQ